MADNVMILAVLALVASVQATRAGSGRAGAGYGVLTAVLVIVAAVLTIKGHG